LSVGGERVTTGIGGISYISAKKARPAVSLFSIVGWTSQCLAHLHSGRAGVAPAIYGKKGRRTNDSTDRLLQECRALHASLRADLAFNATEESEWQERLPARIVPQQPPEDNWARPAILRAATRR
jgi:hypothetical protein